MSRYVNIRNRPRESSMPSDQTTVL